MSLGVTAIAAQASQTNPADDVYAFGDAPFYGSTGHLDLARAIVGMARTASGHGYYEVATDGGVFSYGDARFFGSTGAIHLNRPIVGMAVTPSGNGYWRVATDGGIFSFGDAAFYGSTGAIRLNRPVVGMAPTPSGHGYWLVATDGGLFSFGDAAFYGSTGGLRLNRPIVGMARTPSGHGYWLVATDGGIFSFGDADFHGSTGAIKLAQPITGMASTPFGRGYWLVARDGGIFGFGDAGFYGSMGRVNLGAKSVIGMAATLSGAGYWLVATRAVPPPPPTSPTAPGLILLTIPSKSHQSTYDRAADFGGWISQSGCKDTRAIVLIHDSLASVTYTTSLDCTVATGRWIDPWSGVTTSVAHDFDIDHTVPVANAWYSGAWAWTHDQRVSYYNDLTDTDHLVPIALSENRSKATRVPKYGNPRRLAHGAATPSTGITSRRSGI